MREAIEFARQLLMFQNDMIMIDRLHVIGWSINSLGVRVARSALSAPVLAAHQDSRPLNLLHLVQLQLELMPN